MRHIRGIVLVDVRSPGEFVGTFRSIALYSYKFV